MHSIRTCWQSLVLTMEVAVAVKSAFVLALRFTVTNVKDAFPLPSVSTLTAPK